MKQAYNITINEQPAIDGKWFRLLHKIDVDTPAVGLSRELFTTLGPAHEELERLRKVYERIPFNPDLRPRHIDTSTLKAPLEQLVGLRQRIGAEEPVAVIRQAYSRKIDEVILNNQLLIAAATHDKTSFDRINRQLYGQPDRKIFAAECAWLRKYAGEYARSVNPDIRAAAEAVLRAVPGLRGNQRHIIPRNKVFKQVRDMHFRSGGYFAQLLGGLELPNTVTAENGDPVVRMAIATTGADYTLADSTDELWGVIHHSRQVVRPPGYRLPRAEFLGIVAHEVGSHLLERCNGRRQPLRLMEIGLDRYEQGNEGRAFLREQIIYNAPYDMLHQPGWEYIVLKHFAICLGFGLHKQPYTFRQVYETVYPVCLLFQTIRRPDNPVYAAVAAGGETWHLAVRVLKGTDGHGGAYLKDIVYLEGNVRAWKHAARNPNIILFGDQGKFDIARHEHLQLLAALGIKPAKGQLDRGPQIMLDHLRQIRPKLPLPPLSRRRN